MSASTSFKVLGKLSIKYEDCSPVDLDYTEKTLSTQLDPFLFKFATSDVTFQHRLNLTQCANISNLKDGSDKHLSMEISIHSKDFR